MVKYTPSSEGWCIIWLNYYTIQYIYNIMLFLKINKFLTNLRSFDWNWIKGIKKQPLEKSSKFDNRVV